MTINTTTQISAPVNVIFQMTLLRVAQSECPYFLGSTAAEITEHRGTYTAKWRRYENVTPTTTALTELTGSLAFPTRTGNTVSITDLTATVAKYGDFIILNEEVDLLNFTNQAEALSKMLGIQAGRSLNRLQRNLMEDSFTAFLAGTATTASGIYAAATASSGIMKSSEIQHLNNTLSRNDAMKWKPRTTGSTNIGTTPIRDAFWGICHVDAEEDLRVLTGFVAAETYASQTAVRPNEFGAVRGVRFLSTTESSIDTGSGASATASATGYGRATSGRYDIYNTPIFGQDAHGSVGLGFEHVKEQYQAGDKLPGIQVINHARGSAGSADPLNEVSTMGWKSWHAGVVLNSTWARTFRHGVTLLESNE